MRFPSFGKPQGIAQIISGFRDVVDQLELHIVNEQQTIVEAQNKRAEADASINQSRHQIDIASKIKANVSALIEDTNGGSS